MQRHGRVEDKVSASEAQTWVVMIPRNRREERPAPRGGVADVEVRPVLTVVVEEEAIAVVHDQAAMAASAVLHGRDEVERGVEIGRAHV